MAHLSDLLNDGDYSMLFLQKKVKGTVRNILIRGKFKRASRLEPGLALIFRVTGLVDADGDGVRRWWRITGTMRVAGLSSINSWETKWNRYCARTGGLSG